MSGVDNRVVSMTFDNSQFERKMSETIKSLDALKKSLDFTNSKKSMDDLSSSAGRMDLSSIARGVEGIAGKFSALGAIGFTVIQGLTRQFLTLAKSIAGKVWDPLIEGGKTRALNIEQAQFQFRGLGIDVDKAMKSSLAAVKGTAYGLDEAAKAASQFAASGIDIGDKMTGALRGVAGAAAMTGSSFSDIARIFTQSAASGKVNTMDLQQFASRGLNVAAALGKVMGKTEMQVREMASSGKLDFKTFSEGMDQAFGKHAQEANQTFTGALANMKAALARLGASWFGPELQQQRDILNALSPVIDNVTASLKPMIDLFLAFSRVGADSIIGRLAKVDLTKFTAAIHNFNAGFLHLYIILQQVMKPIKEAFHEVFTTGVSSTILTISESFKKFTENLKVGKGAAEGIKEAFKAVFSVMEIGWTVVKGIFSVFASLLGVIGHVASGFSGAAGGVAEFFIHMNEILVTGGGIERFFQHITDYIGKLGPIVDKVKDKIANIFGGAKGIAGSDKVENVVGRVSDRMSTLHENVKNMGKVFKWLGDRAMELIHALDPVWQYIDKWATELKDRIANVFKPGDFNALLDGINTGLLGGLLLILRNFMKNGLNINLGGSFMKSVTGMFDQLTGTLKAMQTQIKAEALVKIAIAMAILTASLVVLSLIDSASLTKALVGTAVGLGELVGVFALLDKISTGTSAAKFVALSIGMGILAGAMLLLSFAIHNLSGLSWSELTVGLVGVASALLIMAGASKILSNSSGGLIKTGIGMIIISAGLLIMSKAVQSFAGISWGDMLHGFVGVAAGLLIVAGAMQLMPANMILTAAGLVIVGVGLLILAKAVQAFAGMKWSEMGKGFAGIAGGLLIIAGAMQLMPMSLPITAAGLILVGFALKSISGVVMAMGQMKWQEMAKGLGGLAAMLAILAVALYAMEGALPGAAALIVAAGALAILGGVLKVISGLSWGELLKGLVGIAAVLAVLGVAALVMQPIIPALLGLGAALLVVGAGFALFGAGAYLVAMALEALAKSGEAGAKAMVNVLETLITMVPKLMTALAKGTIEYIKTIVDAAPIIVKGLGVILGLLIDVLIDLVPKLGKLIQKLLETVIKLIRFYIPAIADLGLDLILALLQGIRDHIGEIVTLVGEIITTFLDEMSTQLDAIVQSVADLFVNFMTSVAEAVGKVASTLMFGVAAAFIKGFVDGLKGGEGSPQQWFFELAGKVLGWIGDVLTTLWQKGSDFITGLFDGIQSAVGKVSSFFTGLIGSVISWIGDTARTLWDKGSGFIGGILGGIGEKAGELSAWFTGVAKKVIGWVGDTARTLWSKGTGLIGGILGGIREKWNEVSGWFGGLAGKVTGAVGNVGDILKNIGSKIIDGLWNGMKETWNKVSSWLGDIGSKIASLKGPPEKDAVILLENGHLIMQGLHKGMAKEWAVVEEWLGSLDPADALDPNMTANMSAALSGALSDAVKGLEDMNEFSPTITPVLDLTSVQQDAALINGMIAVAPMSAQLSMAQATTIAHTTDAVPVEQAAPPTIPSEVHFEQNIYAPTALSTNDIYRNTRSQIVLAKEELSIP